MNKGSEDAVRIIPVVVIILLIIGLIIVVSNFIQGGGNSLLDQAEKFWDMLTGGAK